VTTTTTASSIPTGDPALLSPAAWVELHGDYLYNFAIGQVRDPLVAQDLVQDTFLAALKARERFSGNSSERTWLVSILRHKIMDHLRMQYRRPTIALDVGGEASDGDAWGESMVWVHEVAADCLEPHRRLELDEFRESLQQALGRLPARLAQVFEMYEMNECSGREVCEAVQISEQNLWVMLHRARKQLREELASWWPGRGSKPSPGERN